MCHHWDYEHAYERADEPETDEEPETTRFEVIVEDETEPAEEEPEPREDDPLTDVPFADD